MRLVSQALSTTARDALEDPRFREALMRLVKRRVPAADVEDIVQSALAEAVLSEHAPRSDADTLRRWIWGVARHKVVDFHRRPRAELRLRSSQAYAVAVEAHGSDAPAEANARDWMRWATRELPRGADAEETLQWMLREGDGEALESIADEANVPAPRVRQRVSRLRKHLRTRWAHEVAALAALGVLFSAAWFVWQHVHRPTLTPMASPEIGAPRHVAERLRAEATELEGRGQDAEALQRLERARRLDPEGDASEPVRGLHERLERKLAPQVPAPLAPTPSAPIRSETKPVHRPNRSKDDGKPAAPKSKDPGAFFK